MCYKVDKRKKDAGGPPLLPGYVDAVPPVVIDGDIWEFQPCGPGAQVPEKGHLSPPHLHCEKIGLWGGK